MKTETLHALLMDVRWSGSAKIQKRPLLWMLGRVNDHASAWSLLLDEWEELGFARNELFGHEVGEHITLIYGRPVAVTSWSGG